MTNETVLYRRVVSPGGRVSYIEDGRRWDGEVWPLGWHIVGVRPGERTVLYGVEADHAGLLAALREHQSVVQDAIMQAMSAKPVPDTATARKAYEAYRAAGGCDGDVWLRGSAWDVFDAIMQAVVACVEQGKVAGGGE